LSRLVLVAILIPLNRYISIIYRSTWDWISIISSLTSCRALILSNTHSSIAFSYTTTISNDVPSQTHFHPIFNRLFSQIHNHSSSTHKTAFDSYLNSVSYYYSLCLSHHQVHSTRFQFYSLDFPENRSEHCYGVYKYIFPI